MEKLNMKKQIKREKNYECEIANYRKLKEEQSKMYLNEFLSVGNVIWVFILINMHCYLLKGLSRLDERECLVMKLYA